MQYIVDFLIVFVVSSVVWVVALTTYNLVVGSLHFGELSKFTLKSALLVAVVSGILLIPFGGLLALMIWWIGIVLLFGMDFWEAKIIVAVIWACSILIRFVLVSTQLPSVAS